MCAGPLLFHVLLDLFGNLAGIGALIKGQLNAIAGCRRGSRIKQLGAANQIRAILVVIIGIGL